MENEFEWIEFLGLIAFTFAEFYDTGYSVADYRNDKYIERIRLKVKPHISERFLMYTRFVLYGLIATSIFMFWREREHQEKRIFDSVMTIYVCNILLNKFWMPVFFGMHRFKLGTIMALLMFFSSVSIVILMGVMKNFWLSFGLFMPYVIWCLFATFISFMYAKEAYRIPHSYGRRSSSHLQSTFSSSNENRRSTASPLQSRSQPIVTSVRK
jgi:tryptophan-rich sensory protein